jgi:RHS repeat-associated protein
MSEVEGGDYELAKAVESGTQQVLIPAIKDMGQTLEKVSASVGTGADRVADTALEADATAAQGLHDAGNALDGAAGEGGVNPNEGANTSGSGQPRRTSPTSGATRDDFSGGDEGGQYSGGDLGCANGGVDPVDVVSGQMIITKTDVSLPGVLPLVLRRAYASGYGHGSLFGPGWSSTLDERLVIDADGIHYLGDDAQILNYGVPTQPGQRMLPVAGARWPLTWDRALDAIEILDPATGVTRHFALASRTTATGADRRQVRHLTRITDRNDNWLTINRDEDGVPSEIDHVGGYRITVDSAYRGDGFRIEGLRLLDQISSGGVPLIAYAYDPAGRLVEIFDTDDALIYEYDDNHRITAWVDRAGYRFDYTYDAEGRVIRAGGEDGTLTATLEYDLDARCTKIANSSGSVSEYWYDENNHLTKTVDRLGNATLMRHDRFGRLLEQTDPLGNTTCFVRDEAGNVRELHRPDGSQVLTEYDESHQPVSVTTPGGAVSRFEYDARGNLTVATDATGAVTRYVYNGHGAVTGVIDPLGHTTVVTANSAGLPLSITDPIGAVWAVARDALGRVESSADPLGNTTTFEFDTEGRATARVYPDGSRETWTYDPRGDLTGHIDRAGFETTFEYGAFHKILARTDPDGSRYEFGYDKELRLTSVTSPACVRWTYEYDVAGNLIAEHDFNGRRVAYAYDVEGRLARRINGAEEGVSFVRDALGRIIEQRYPDDSQASFAYDADGALVHAANQDVQIEFVRDALGRVVAESINSRTLSKTYDALGNLLSRTTPNVRVSNWRYDDAGRPLLLTSGDREISFGHDAVGRETHRWLGTDAAVTHEWDRAGRLTARRLLSISGPADSRASTVLQERTWTYRADGNPESLAESVGESRRFTLDALGRVTAVSAETWTEQYAYDAAGNLTQAADTRSPDSPVGGAREYRGTLLRRAGRTSYQYDSQSRLVRSVRRTLSGSEKISLYSYDADDRLTRVQTPDGRQWRYIYDPLGRRIAKQRLDETGSIVEETRFTWDGETLAEQEFSRPGADELVVTTWDYEPGSSTPLTQDTRRHYAHAPQEVIDRQFHAIITDLIGTPTELVGPGGEIAWRRSADLWGGALPTTEVELCGSNRTTCPLRFPGQYHDPETGLDYNYKRYYDPATGRYTTPDPLGLAPAMNHHGYVDNPLVWHDVLGLAPGDVEWVDPKELWFSQHTISGNNYAELMQSGQWDWSQEGSALRVLEMNGHLVTYDNRRLDAALEAGQERVPITRLNATDPDPASTTGRTWEQSFKRRFNSPRNRAAKGRVPDGGTKDRPIVDCP